MTNIWIINHYARHDSGRHFNISRALTERGYSVRIFRANTVHLTGKEFMPMQGKFEPKNYSGIDYVFIKARAYSGNGIRRILNILDFTLRLLPVVDKAGFEIPDCIIASSVHPFAWWLGRRLSKKYQVPFITETRDLWPETFVSMGRLKQNGMIARAMYAYEKHYYTVADALIFTTEGCTDYLESRGLYLKNVHYINNGVSLPTFDQNMKAFPNTFPELEDEDLFKVVYAGSMGKANNVSEILDCAKHLQDAGHTDIRFHLFGDGYERANLMQKASDLRLENVIFMEWVDRNRIPGILSKSDLNIVTGMTLPFYKYGLSSNKMFEYLASGKPAITNITSGYDVLKTYHAGVSVPGGSGKALAEGILGIRDLPQDKYKDLCRNARAAAYEFDYDRLARKVEAAVLDAMGKHQKSIVMEAE